MRIPRVTIGRLMVIVVFLALGLSALARPTKLGASLLSGSIISALTIALIGVMLDRGKRRAFLVGFLIAGCAYIATDYWGKLEDLFTKWDFPESATIVLTAVFNPTPPEPVDLPMLAPAPMPKPIPADTLPTMPPPVDLDPAYPNVIVANRLAYAPPPSPFADLTDRDPTVFGRTVHMLLAWSAATAGGLVARWLFMTRREVEIESGDGRPA